MTEDNGTISYKRKAIVGGLIIVLLSALLPFLSVTNIRQLLDENPTAQLILVEGFEKNRLEMIGRSPDPDIEYVKWRFEDIYLKSYIERDLVSTSEWRLYNGTTQVKYREIKDITYNYTRTEA